MRHVLSAVVQNVPGVLAHISGMLASRGYNIDSLAVGETEEPNLSRMTFVVVGGGATGVEMAGAISELARHTMRNDFRKLNPAKARIVLVEFSDFECPYCAKAATKVDEILKAFPNDARLVYKQYPIATHPNAAMAAAAKSVRKKRNSN
jgi:acetolactate synthase small subunit